ncbi:MAG: zinc ABC transporter substrate-binding protein [Thiotrichales bacterium]|nr:zinc ABC transporter substrate-binding protein [Thiotrichales bacterium]
MPRILPRILLLISVFVELFLSSAIVHAGKDKLSIFVTIPPQKYLVERIAEDNVSVTALNGVTDKPESYEPSPGQMQALLKGDVYIPIGLASEHKWTSVLRKQSPDMTIVDCCQQFMTLGEADHHHDHQHQDPHIWTDPILTLQIGEVIRDTLIQKDPARSDLYRENFQKLAAELTMLDESIARVFNGKQKKSFIVSHPAWSYFAKRYGLEQIVLEHEGREIGPRTMSEKIIQAREQAINTVFIQRQHNSLTARRLAEEIDARIVMLNPLKEDHIENIEKTAILIAESLGQ